MLVPPVPPVAWKMFQRGREACGLRAPHIGGGEAPDPDRERTQAGGAAVTGQRDHHADPAAPNSLPEDLHATEAAAGVGNESAPVLPGAPDLPDLSDPGDLGDVSDLPELALDA